MLLIEFLRRERELTQWKLGQAAQITNYKISQIECGKLVPTAAESQRLAEALGVSPETLTKEVGVSEGALLIA